MTSGKGRALASKELNSATISSSRGETKDNGETTTALVPYVPPPHLECLFDESVFLNGVELSARGRVSSSGPYLLGDVVPTLLSYCDAAALSRAACVCAEWRRVSQCDDLWENLCRTRFGVSASEIRPRPDPTKLLYILAHRRLREVCRTGANPFTGRARSVGRLPTVPFMPISGS